MILRKVIPTCIVCSCLSPSAPAQKVFPSPSTIPPSSAVEHTQNFSEIVVPITSVKITPSAKLGITGKLGPKLPTPHSMAPFSSGAYVQLAASSTYAPDENGAIECGVGSLGPSFPVIPSFAEGVIFTEVIGTTISLKF